MATQVVKDQGYAERQPGVAPGSHARDSNRRCISGSDSKRREARLQTRACPLQTRACPQKRASPAGLVGSRLLRNRALVHPALPGPARRRPWGTAAAPASPVAASWRPSAWLGLTVLAGASAWEHAAGCQVVTWRNRPREAHDQGQACKFGMPEDRAVTVGCRRSTLLFHATPSADGQSDRAQM